MRRKFLSVVLCVCMMLTMAPFAFAAGETEIQASTTELSSGSYILKNDITLTSGALTIPANETVSINLNNHKLTNNDGDHTIVNNGTLTITGRGTVDNVSNGTAALYNNAGATATLNGGTYTRSCEAGKSADNSGGNSYYTLKNFGTMTINSGVTVNQGADGNGKYSSLVANGWQNAGNPSKNQEPSIQRGGAQMTITGGTFNGGLNTIKNDDCGTLTVSGGTFQNYTQTAFQNHNVATVNGGTFIAAEGTSAVINCGVASCPVTDNDKHEATINGGVFIGKITKTVGTISINGGVFKAQVSGSTQKGELYVYPSTNPVAEIGNFKFSNLADAAYAAADGDTITLLANTTLYEKLQLNRKVVLDLGNYTITRASTGEQRAIWVNSGADVTINSGSNGCVTAPVIALQVNNGGKLTVNGGAYHGAYALASFSSADKTAETIINNGVFDGWIYTNGTGHKDYITFNGGTYNEMMYLASGDQSTYTITNGTFKKGLEIDAGRLDISGGTFTANEDTSGNVNNPITNNNGSGAYVGTIVVCKPSGSSTTGYIGDAVVNITGGTFENAFANSETIVVADYGQSQNQAGKAKVTISGDAKVTGKVVLYKATGNTGEQLDISGGYFTSDPTAYVTTGYTAVETTEPGYNYKVVEASNLKADVAPAAPTVSIPDSFDNNQKAAAETVSDTLKASSDTVTGGGLNAAANAVANNNSVNQAEATNALGEKGITPTQGQSVRVVVQTYMNINIKDVNTANTDKKTLTLDITPMYRTVATTAAKDETIVLADTTTIGANAVTIGAPGKLTINKPVTIKLPLPAGFVSPKENGSYDNIYVQHKGHEYIAVVTAQQTSAQDATTPSQTLFATFTNPDGFSTFTISSTSTAVAKIGDNRYTTLQDAVDAVKDNETIDIVGTGNTLSATVSGNKTFTVNANSNTVNLTAASGYNLTKDGDKYTVSRQHSSSSGSTSTTYNVNVNAATNGAVAADKKTASKGTTVTVTASPSKGYVVDAVKVVDKDGKDVAVTEKDGKYVFTMPASAVTVTGTFKAETPAPVALPFTDVKSGNWFYDAVKYAYAQGLMTGTSATTFAPNGTMNRAMIVTVLYRLEKSPAVTGASKFTDVPAGQWYSDAVAWAAANKIVNGYDETTFGPMNAVTREQMAAILFRYEQYKGLENVTLEENLNRFPDQNKISAYAIPALQWAVGQKIINGNADGTLDPTGTATRAQVAQIFTNLLNQ